MNENIRLFLEKISKDEESLAKMQSITDPDEAYAFAASIQDGFTKEEFIDTMNKLHAAQNGEISDEDLEKLAGGVSWEESVSYTVTAVVSGASAISATYSIALGAASAAAI